MFLVQTQWNNNRNNNKSQRQTIGVDGVRYRRAADSHPRDMAATLPVIYSHCQYDQGLSHLLHTELQWLDVPERVLYKLALMVHRCLQDKAPQYLSNYCVPVSEVASHQQPRSVSRHRLLLIPQYCLRTFSRRAFAVAGPTFWNSLADELRTYSRFKLALKTFFFAYSTH